MRHVPLCPECNTEMVRDQSFYPDEHDTFIEYYWRCPKCGLTHATREVI